MGTKKYDKLIDYIEYMEDSLELKDALRFEKEKDATLDEYIRKLKKNYLCPMRKKTR